MTYAIFKDEIQISIPCRTKKIAKAHAHHIGVVNHKGNLKRGYFIKKVIEGGLGE